MKTLLKISIISCILLCLLVSLAPSSMANNSYVVHGQVTDNSGGHPNGITITVKDTETDETLTVNTYQDALNKNGTFQVDLGNLVTAWQRNDTITISGSYHGYTNSTSFEIPYTGTIYGQDILLNIAEHGGAKPKERGGGGLATGFDMWFILIVVFLILLVLFAAYMNRKK